MLLVASCSDASQEQLRDRRFGDSWSRMVTNYKFEIRPRTRLWILMHLVSIGVMQYHQLRNYGHQCGNPSHTRFISSHTHTILKLRSVEYLLPEPVLLLRTFKPHKRVFSHLCFHLSFTSLVLRCTQDRFGRRRQFSTALLCCAG